MDRFNLGAYGRPISTRSAETQRWFDIGLNWCYGFNHEEGIKCFKKALESDPGCAMVHWGIAYAAGPFYNLTWKEHGDAEANSATRRCFEHVQLARANAAHASPVERRLIEALGHRFQKPHRVTPQEFEQWDDAYAAEMRPVYVSFPDDHDVMALFVEALMMRTVRRLWDLKTGAPAPNSDVIEALQVCERSIRLSDEADIAQHPAIVHLHIHLLEMSHMPERGMRSACRVRRRKRSRIATGASKSASARRISGPARAPCSRWLRRRKWGCRCRASHARSAIRAICFPFPRAAA